MAICCFSISISRAIGQGQVSLHIWDTNQPTPFLKSALRWELNPDLQCTWEACLPPQQFFNNFSERLQKTHSIIFPKLGFYKTKR